MDDETNVAVALGKIEERLKSMDKKLDNLAGKFDQHHDTLSAHESRLAVLESKATGWKTVAAILSPLVAIAALGFVILNALYA